MGKARGGGGSGRAGLLSTSPESPRGNDSDDRRLELTTVESSPTLASPTIPARGDDVSGIRLEIEPRRLDTDQVSAHTGDLRSFVAEEARRRSSNAAERGHLLYLSHSWSEEEESEVHKRQVIASLSDPKQVSAVGGLAYWSDFLDQDARSAVPWCHESKHALTSCSKFVCLVTQSYLTSFQNLRELAYAVHHSKAISVLVLDDASWDLLNSPAGPQTLWASPALSSHEGQELIPGERLSFRSLTRLLAQLDAGMLLRCPPSVGATGAAYEHVSRGLPYAEQHAELQTLAECWEDNGRKRRLLLGKKEAERWDRWCSEARRRPRVTDLQREYLRESLGGAASAVSQKCWILAVVLLALVAVGAGAAAGLMAVMANNIEADAEVDLLMSQQAAANAANTASINNEQMEALLTEQKAEVDRQKALAFAAASDANGASQQAAELQAGLEAAEAEVALLQAALAAREAQASSDAQAAAAEHSALVALAAETDLTVAQLTQQLQENEEILANASNQAGLLAITTGQRDSYQTEAGEAKGAILSLLALEAAMPTDGITSADSEVLDLWQLNVARAVLELMNETTTQEPAKAALLTKARLMAEEALHRGLAESLLGHSSPLTAISWSIDGQWLATGDTSGVTIIWQLGTAHFPGGGEGEVRELPPLSAQSGGVSSLAWSPSGNGLSAGYASGEIRLWTIYPMSAVNLDGPHSSEVLSLSWSSDGQLLASGAADGICKVWTVSDLSAPAAHLLDHTGPVSSVSWPLGSQLDQTLATSDAAGVHLWDLSQPNVTSAVLTIPSEGVSAISWSVGASQLAAARSSATDDLCVWTLDGAGSSVALSQTTCRSLASSCLGGLPEVQTLEWSAAGLWVAAAGREGFACLWGPEDLNGESPEGAKVVDPRLAASQALTFAPQRFSPLSSARLASAGSDHVVRLYAELHHTMRMMPPIAPQQFANFWPWKLGAVSWDPTGATLAVGMNTGGVWAWAADGSRVMVLESHDSYVWAVEFSPDGRYLASSASDGSIKAFAVASNGTVGETPVQSFQLDGGVWSLSWSPDGLWLAAVSGSTVTVLGIGSGASGGLGNEPLQVVSAGDALSSVAWSPDGLRIAASRMDDAVVVWSVSAAGHVDNSEGPQVLAGHSGWIQALSWAPDGRLASASMDKTVRVWARAADGSLEGNSSLVLEGHTASVQCLHWNPSGTRLASGSSDNTVRIWELGEGPEYSSPVLSQVLAHDLMDETITGVAWAPDGEGLLSVSHSGSVLLWDSLTFEYFLSQLRVWFYVESGYFYHPYRMGPALQGPTPANSVLSELEATCEAHGCLSLIST